MTEYVMAGASADTESVRLAALEADRDPSTIRRLDGLGVGPGWSCLEVGAGRGSIARWLAERVGPTGRVVAADIDCRFLTGLPDSVEVRTLDIREDSPERDTYDVVHSRALIMHLPDPMAALRRMAASLRPGGVLLTEEGDYALLNYGGHPDGAACTEVVHRIFGALAASGRMNAYLGRTLPSLVLDAGLELIGGEVETHIARRGAPALEFQRVSAQDAAPGLVASGVVTEAEAARMIEVMSDPRTVMTSPSVVAVWGRRPL